MNLVDKDIILAAVKKLHDAAFTNAMNAEKPNDYLQYTQEVATTSKIMGFISALDKKEIDIEKEYKEFVSDDPVYSKLVNSIVGLSIAKHFYELGLTHNHGTE